MSGAGMRAALAWLGQPIVAINKFFTDSDEELAVILDRCAGLGLRAAVAA